MTGYIFYGDGGTDAVYRLRDLNGDGDAQDAGEANLWFDSTNFHGRNVTSPNGLYQDSEGALYIMNSGTLSSPPDAVYRADS